MKRPALEPDPFSAQSKRQRNGEMNETTESTGPKTHAAGVTPSNHTHTHAPARHNRSNQPARPAPKQQNGKQHLPRPQRHPAPGCSDAQDPAIVLETLLKSLVSQPDAVNRVLGAPALDHATQLLASISARDRSSKTSLDLFRPSTVQQPSIPAYHDQNTIQKPPFPALPSVPDGPYTQAVFTHKSSISTNDRTSGSDLTYEKLEFLGDAYLETISTRIIFSRFPHLAVGRQAQVRERCIKNDTLTGFSVAYNFKERIQSADHMRNAGKVTDKILADVFEAYVAAIILSDPDHGFERAEEWLSALWAPILLAETETDYDANAKQTLQQKIQSVNLKLDYLEDSPMQQAKHVQTYFIGLYITGFGHDKKKIGYGEGRNKVEAGNRAAMDAMLNNKEIVDQVANMVAQDKEKRRLEKETKAQA